MGAASDEAGGDEWLTIVKDLTAGTVGGCASILAGQPLDTVKVRLQARGDVFRGTM